jgi:hypothetical protein
MILRDANMLSAPQRKMPGTEAPGMWGFSTYPVSEF